MNLDKSNRGARREKETGLTLRSDPAQLFSES